jgi:Cytochrome c7 and related cytochrome c
MQIFRRSTNAIARASLVGAVCVLALLGWVVTLLMRSGFVTGQGAILHQPVPFSHQHHVAGLGIDCRYCHTSVEKSAKASLPPTETCMNCHKQIWTNADLLEPVRASYRTGVPISWSKTHDLPDFVYFNHSVHVAKGVACVTCHGRVDKMPLMYQEQPLTMEWCLACHRDPVKNIRPREEVFNMDWQPPANFEAQQAKLAQEYDVQSLTSCSTCHR